MPNPKDRGRIRISDRKVNDNYKIIGDNLGLKEDYLPSIQYTEMHSTLKKHELGIATT